MLLIKTILKIKSIYHLAIPPNRHIANGRLSDNFLDHRPSTLLHRYTQNNHLQIFSLLSPLCFYFSLQTCLLLCLLVSLVFPLQSKNYSKVKSSLIRSELKVNDKNLPLSLSFRCSLSNFHLHIYKLFSRSRCNLNYN